MHKNMNRLCWIMLIAQEHEQIMLIAQEHEQIMLNAQEHELIMLDYVDCTRT